ncbi:citrinin biosynthesis oxidoreductase CtnB [Trichoderma gamsii]|uniref:Citrinin biosynthesis oxidoreductase CtnB n=1 Tax=Trichoderma gamsii TaxID=398673 RepID=A0A2P4ZW39_9HYPO|nr:citrinin biosynthesis oxidoreductase CtnB [Trichoderma gamsii]PON28516.1 citrinin biosynthesis oxidoreductase CtnB [Trichoderma gamsii]
MPSSSPYPALATTSSADNGASDSLDLPRILCLHGGGTNARIFAAQCRVLRAALSSTFRFVFAEAPFPSRPGPDVVSVYGTWGPFKSWLRLQDGDAPGLDSVDIVEAVDTSLADAMISDDALGATGEWVGLLGFSQGAKMAASLLLRQQARATFSRHSRISTFRFAVLFAGRAPLVALDNSLQLVGEYLADAVQISSSAWRPPAKDLGRATSKDSHATVSPSGRYWDRDVVGKLAVIEDDDHLLRLPTIHVHGLSDPGLLLHQDLLGHFCTEESATVVEWGGAHRMPIKTADVRKVVTEICRVAAESGAIGEYDVL